VSGWSLDPATLAVAPVLAALYARRLATLRRRGIRVPARKPLAFSLSIATLVLAVTSPVDQIGEERLFSVHMVQHVLIGDGAPLLAVLGLSGALLRPVLALPGAARLRVLVLPWLAVPLWAADLYAWHVPALYDTALADTRVHALEHAMFFACGTLLWSSILALLPGPRRIGHGARLAALAGVWVAGGVLANVFLWSNRAFYAPYRDAPRLWGLSPVADQRIGGGVMLLEMSVVVVAVALVVGVRWLGAEPTALPRTRPRAPRTPYGGRA